jgi:hypothetical protein
MKAKLTLACVYLIITGLVFSGQSLARIALDSIVAIYLFDNDERDVFIDASGNGHDATIFGNGEWVAGKYGQGFELDGATYADVDQDHAEAFSLSIYTVAAWIGNKEIAGHQFVLCKSTGAEGRNYIMNIQEATGLFVCGFSDAQGGAWHPVVSTTSVADGDWHHLAGTYDGQTFKTYVDGVLEKQQALAGPPASNDAPLRIGGGPGQIYRLVGTIDEILITNVALSEDDIGAVMNQGIEKASGITAVTNVGKLTTTWSSIKKH